MKLRAIIIFLLLVGCVGLGLLHKEDLGLIWQQYSSVHRHFEYRDHLRYKKPLISSSTVRNFPEEALMLELILNSYEPYDRMEMLSEGVLAYPDNEYFAFRLADDLLMYSRYEEGLDLSLALMLAERVVDLNPDNANYHYLKAYTLFRNNAGLEEVLDELHSGNRSPLIAMPAEKYKQRLAIAAEEEKLGVSFSGYLDFAGTYNYFGRKLVSKMIVRASVAFAEDDEKLAVAIDDAVKGLMGRTQSGLKGYARFPINPRGQQFGGFGRRDSPQLLELQRSNVSKERLDQNRLELCAMNYRPKPEDIKKNPSKDDFKQQEYVVLPVLAYSWKMFIALGFLALLALPFSLKGSFLKQSGIGFGSFVVFLFCGICFFVGSQFMYLQEIIGFSTCCHYTFIDAFRPGVGMGSFFDDWVLLTGFMFGPIAALLVLKGIGAVNVKKERLWRLWNFRLGAFVLCGLSRWLSKNRLVCILISVVFWAVPAMFLAGYRYWCYFPMIGFAVTVLVISFRKSDAFFFKRYFSVGQDGATLRGRCFCLMLIFMAIYCVAFIFAVPKSAAIIRDYVRPRPKKEHEVYEANEETYQKLLARLDDPELTKEDACRFVTLLRAEDLGGVLDELKQREFAMNPFLMMSAAMNSFSNDPNAMKPRSMGSKEKISDYKSLWKRTSSFDDGDICLLLKNSGRDTLEILVDRMERPESERALLERAKAGDAKVSDKLLNLWDEKIKEVGSDEYDGFERWRMENQDKSYAQRTIRAENMLAGLCTVAAPEQGVKYLIEYIERKDFKSFNMSHEFYESISLLPRRDGAKVLKAYWSKAKECSDVEMSIDRMLHLFDSLGGLYGDRELCEDVLAEIVALVEPRRRVGYWQLPNFFTKDSAELLKEGLLSSNDNLRAWSVWQLNSIGYSWGEDEVASLLSDEGFRVRANIVLGAKGANLRPGEKSNIVRLAGSLAGQ